MSDPEVLARITPSGPRRFFGIAVLAVLGGLLIYLSLVLPQVSLAWRAFLLGLGAVVVFVAEQMRRATELTLELTEEELRETSGRVLARLDDVTGIERGMFAFKPSNGFTLRTRARQGRVWAPGLWWRIGRRIGVGGVTSASEAKAMAETITALLVQRGVKL